MNITYQKKKNDRHELDSWRRIVNGLGYVYLVYGSFVLFVTIIPYRDIFFNLKFNGYCNAFLLSQLCESFLLYKKSENMPSFRKKVLFSCQVFLMLQVVSMLSLWR
jgi:hypothetical protein